MSFPELLGSRAFISVFIKRFLEAFGLLWLAVEPIALFFPLLLPKGWPVYIALVALSFLSGVVWAWPKRVVSVTVPGADVTVEVKTGDLFSASGNVIIGTNDVFDTHIGDGVISNRSVQAQLVNRRFGGSVDTFNTEVENRLSELPFQVDPSKTKGKNKRYALGTVLEIPADGVRHYLCAYCRMPASLRAETDICSLLSSLDESWERIRNTGENEPVSMPVVGGDFGRTGLTQTQLIQIIVLSFVGANRTRHVAPKLTIYVADNNASGVNFVALELWLKGVLWA